MEPQQQPVQAEPSLQRIATPAELQKRCLLPGDGSQAAVNAISRAEQALEELSVNFDDWMQTEVGNLREARDNTKTSGLEGDALDALFSVSHDLKGQASTLGYPFAAEICTSLCRLIDYCTGVARPPAVLIDQHVDAVAAIVREDAKGSDHPKASVLARKLGDVTDDFLNQLSKAKAG